MKKLQWNVVTPFTHYQLKFEVGDRIVQEGGVGVPGLTTYVIRNEKVRRSISLTVSLFDLLNEHAVRE